MEFADIIYTKKDGIAKIVLNRPQVYNAFRTATLKEVAGALEDADLDGTIRVVVLTAAGEKAFCTGGDSKEIKEVKKEEVKEIKAEDLEKVVEKKVEQESTLGLTEGKIIQILGIASWVFVLFAVLTWWVVPVKKVGPRNRMKIHKVFGYAAFAVATIHGLLVLF